MRFFFLFLLCLIAAAPTTHPFQSLEDQIDAFDRTRLPPHPRLVLTPPDITRLQTAITSDFAKPYWSAIRRYVEAGKSVSPPADPPGYPDNKWNVTDWRRIVSVGDEYQTRILASSFVAVITNDPTDFSEAKRWTLAAARLDHEAMTGIHHGVDHPARDIPHAMALSYDWLYNQYTPAERQIIRDSLLARAQGLYNYLHPFRGDSWNNHPWFQTSALVDASLAIADESPQADPWWRYGSKLFLTEFLPKGGRDGDWHEGTHYVSYTLLFTYQFADALKSATGIDPYSSVPWLQKVGRFCLYISPPAGAGIQFNDNNYTPPNLLDKYCAYQSARTTHDPVMQWYGDQIAPDADPAIRHSISTLIAHDPSIPSAPPGPDLPLGVWYRDSGWVVLRTDLSRSDDIQLGLKAGPWHGSATSRGHDHPDQNHFLINANLQPLAVDSGYYDYYGSPHHNGWTFTGKAHNTLLVNGQEQLVGKSGQVLSFVSDRDGFDFIESQAASAYPDHTLDSWRRQILFLRPNLFLIRDLIQPTNASTLSWLLHGPAPFEITSQKFRVTANKTSLVGEMFEPTSLHIEQTIGFPKDMQPERKLSTDFPDQSHLTFTTPTPVAMAHSLMVLTVGPTGVPLPEISKDPAPDNDLYSIIDSAGRRSQVFFLNSHIRPQTLGDITTDARVFAQRTGDPDLATLAVGVTQLSIAGQPLFSSNHPADISGIRTPTGWRRLSVTLVEPAIIHIPFTTGPQTISLDAGSHILLPH